MAEGGYEVESYRHAGRDCMEIRRPIGSAVPVLVVSAHSGRDYHPRFMRQTRLSASDIRRSEDAYMDEILASATDWGASLLITHLPRACVDMNREAHELDTRMFDGSLSVGALADMTPVTSQHVAAGLGVIPRIVAAGYDIYAEKLPVQEALFRLRHYYYPWHVRLEKEIARLKAIFGQCILLDFHSMPHSSLSPVEGHAPVDIILGDCFGLSADSGLIQRLGAACRTAGYHYQLNQPYAGGYITRHYGRPHEGVSAVQIEINRSLYMEEGTLHKHEGFKPMQILAQKIIQAAIPPTLANAAE